MSKLKLFLILASAFLISCTNPNDPGNGNDTGTGGGTGGGGGTGNPSWFLTDADQKTPKMIHEVTLGKTVRGQYYRIPAIIVSDKNTIIAVFDNRHGVNSDIGFNAKNNINPTVKRSTDGGATWSEEIIIGTPATSDATAHGDPLVFKNKKGQIIVLAAAGGAWFTAPTTPSRISVSKSTDDGLTWSDWVDVQGDIFSKQLPALTGSQVANSHFSKGFAASGRGTTLSDGTLACTMLIGSDNGSSMKGAATLYSKDDGTTWKLGGWVQYPGNSYDEPKIVGQLTDGKILMTARPNIAGKDRYWAVADGVEGKWTQVFYATGLIDGRANAEGVRYTLKSKGHSKDRFLFLNCNATAQRTQLTVHISEDECKTWPKKKIVQAKSACYSSIDVLGDGTIITFAEEPSVAGGTDNYDLVFRRFNLAWITDGNEVYSDTW